MSHTGESHPKDEDPAWTQFPHSLLDNKADGLTCDLGKVVLLPRVDHTDTPLQSCRAGVSICNMNKLAVVGIENAIKSDRESDVGLMRDAALFQGIKTLKRIIRFLLT